MANAFAPSSELTTSASAAAPRLDLRLALTPGHGGDEKPRFDADAIVRSIRASHKEGFEGSQS